MVHWRIFYKDDDDTVWLPSGGNPSREDDVCHAAGLMLHAAAHHKAARAVRCDPAAGIFTAGAIVPHHAAFQALTERWLLPTAEGDGVYAPADLARQKAIAAIERAEGSVTNGPE